jgi:immune inhibitor A
MNKKLFAFFSFLVITCFGFANGFAATCLGFDSSIANDDALIKMLERTGKVAPSSSVAAKQQALKTFLQAKSNECTVSLKNDTGELAKYAKQKRSTVLKKMKAHGKTLKTQGVELTTWSGPVRTDRVLAILIEYPDFPHNTVTSEETDMYYDDYTTAHYRDLLFADTNYAGPNNEALRSMKSHYFQASGGSYIPEGDVAGWYMASQPAAFYGTATVNVRVLVREALAAVAADSSFDITQYDQEDRYDLDGDGNYREPDGLIDHLMIFHSSVGEEAGGGALGEAAVWSHRWNLGYVFTLDGTTADVPYWGGELAAYDYTIQPIDAASGVATHEYGHDLGLPDEYDTQSSGEGEPVQYWSMMARGSWGGLIPGSEPSNFSPWAKQFLQASMGGNWLHGSITSLDNLVDGPQTFLLDQGSSKGTNNEYVRVNLPAKSLLMVEPFAGSYEFFSQADDDLNTSMSVAVDLTNATSAQLDFKAWYEIEQDYDYGRVLVSVDGGPFQPIAGNITTTDDPNHIGFGIGFCGATNGWIDAQFDLSAFAGHNIVVAINYLTDGGWIEQGLFVDDAKITVDGQVVIADGAEGTPLFALNGFEVSGGYKEAAHYYLLEWRNHQGVDVGLGHIKRGLSVMTYDPGLVIWYVDDSMTDNWVGFHPGEGWIGVVDADQTPVRWADGTAAETRYQIHDAAFGLRDTQPIFLEFDNGTSISDTDTMKNKAFHDGNSFIHADMPDAGRIVPNYGLKIKVVGENADRSIGQVRISLED